MFNQQQATQILSTLVGQMTARNSPFRLALSDTQGEMEDHGGDQPESRGSTAPSLISPANSRTIANDIEAEQPETVPQTTTGPPYDSYPIANGKTGSKGGQCSQWCSCVCHSRRTFFVPSPIGTVSGSFSGFSLLKRRCTEHACKGPTDVSASIVVQFHDWF